MTTLSIFTGPGSANLSGPGTSTNDGIITVGSSFKITGPDVWWLTGYKYWVADGPGTLGTAKFTCQQVSDVGTLAFNSLPAATVTASATTIGAWNTIMLPTPVPLSPGQIYQAATGTTANISSTASFWSSGAGAGGLTNGVLTFPQTTDNFNPQSAFHAGSPDPVAHPPDTSSSAFNCWIDVIITDQPPAGTSYELWPSLPVPPNVGPVTETATLGTRFKVTQACNLNRIKFYSPPGATSLPTWAGVWDTFTHQPVIGADNSSPAWSGTAGSGFITVSFTGVTLQPGSEYIASVFGSGTWDTENATYFGAGPGSAGRTSGGGILLAPNNSGSTLEGVTFIGGNANYDNLNGVTQAFPTQSNTESMWVEPVVTPVTTPVPPAGQAAFAAIRAALATYLTTSIGLRATANRFQQINPPMAVIMPQTGSFIRYSTSFEGETDYSLRAVILVSEGDSLSGQDTLDTYLSPVGANSVYAAIQRDPTLGGTVSYAAVIEATAYGLMNFNGIDYLAAHLVLNVGT